MTFVATVRAPKMTFLKFAKAFTPLNSKRDCAHG